MYKACPEEDFDRPPDFDTSMLDGDFEAVLRRLQHVYIKVFCFNIAHTAFLRHFVANARDVDFVVERTDFDSKQRFSFFPHYSMRGFS